LKFLGAGSDRGDIPASQAWNGTIFSINVRRLAAFDPDQNAVAALLVVILRNMGNAILTRCAMQQVMKAKEHRTSDRQGCARETRPAST
jgi:hypothetical protein